MTRSNPTIRPVRLWLAAGSGVLFGLGTAAPTLAQETSAPSPDYFDELKTCRAIPDEDKRLECYDAAVAEVLSASEAGDVRIVDRADVRRTRRQLFGFTVPDLDILEGDAEDKAASELFETTITSARQLSSKSWRFTTAEKAVWEIGNAPRRLAPIEPGDKVQFKKASLGYFFIRINGQMGVKGQRIQ